MLICAAGDTHGALNRLYADVLAFERELGARFDHVLHVGDFGIWPDPERVDRATRKHEGAGDFPAGVTGRARIRFGSSVGASSCWRFRPKADPSPCR